MWCAGLSCIMLLGICLISTCEGSAKKGVSVSYHGYLCGDLEAFDNIHWWYDWQQTPWYHTHKNCGDVKTGRVPMVWGWRDKIDNPLHTPHDANIIMGFNEPNFHSQANLTASEAAHIWRTKIQPRGIGKTLVSPAAAKCSTQGKCYGDALEWLKQFFHYCSECHVDYIATHAYYCDPDRTMDYLKSLWNQFQKPIWLTEFACPHTHSYSKQLSYMKAILPKLEVAHYVSRYAWYTSRHQDNGFTTHTVSLLHTNSSKLTTLGQYYNNF